MALFTQRVGKIFFHLRALLRRQYLIHFKIVLHAVITHLLINLC